VRQMMKGFDIGIQEKKAKLFNEWEMFTSTDGESIESYYHRFSKLMNDFKRNKHFLAKTQDPLALMANSNNSFKYLITQLGMNLGQDNQMHMVGGNGGNQFRQYVGHNVGNQEEVGIQLQAEEFNLIASAADLDEIEETDKAHIYDSDISAEVQLHDKCYNDEIFNMFTQEEQYTELLEPIPEPHQVPQNDSNVISEVSSVEQGGGTVEQHPVTVEETRVYQESSLLNLVAEVEKVNMVNCKMRETNAKLTTELARYKNQEKCFEISQEKYDKLERCYQQSVYQEQCLTKKINALHLSSGKQITALNEEISNLNKQLSKEKSTVSSLLEEKKRLKSDFKIREDELLDKQVQLENKIKELDNILVKMGQSIQTMHMLSPKPDSFYHSEHKMALGYQNPFYLKQAQQKQQSLYNGKVLLRNNRDSQLVVFCSPRDLQNSDESLAMNKALELEIECLLRAVVSQDIMSIVHNNFVVDTSNLQTELDQCKYDKISYDKAYNDMHQKIERLQAQLGDQKGKSKDTPYGSNTLDPLPQKLENENVELEFQVQNYEKENAHLKTAYKNLFDSINVTRTQTKLIIDSLQNKLHDTIYENAKLRAQLFDKVSDQKDTTKGTSTNTKFANQSTERKPFLQSLRNQFVVRQPNAFKSERQNASKTQIPQKVDKTHDLSNPVTSNSVPTTEESKVVDNDKVIAPGMFRINPFKNPRVEKFVPNKPSKASVRTNPITASQPHVIIKKAVNSDSNGFSSTGVDITTKTRRPQPRSNTKNDRVPSASKSSRIMNKEVDVEDHPRNLLLSTNKKPLSSECNNIKLAIRNDKSKIVYAMYLEVAFRRNTCFILNLEGVDLLKGNHTTNLYTINLHDMASTSLICLMARTTSTKSWLWHQRLSHLNFHTINDLARNDLVIGLPKFKYNKEHLCPSCEQGKSKRDSHPPKPVPNSKQRAKDKAPEEIKNFLKRITVLLQVLQEYFKIVGITHQASSVPIATACYTQNRSIIHRRFDKTPYELINGRKPDISFLHVFGALCYPKNDREDIGKLGAKGDIGFFIGYSANSCAYRVYNRRTKKIMETMNVTFDDLSASTPWLLSKHGQPSQLPRTILAAQAPQVLHTPTTTTTTADTVPTPTNSLSQATSITSFSQNVDDLETQQQHGQPHPGSTTDNVPNDMFNDNTFVNPFATPSISVTKDHPLEQVIGEPSRLVLTWNQLKSDGDMCMYALTVSTKELKNVNEAMTDPAWIESMQEELLQFNRLMSLVYEDSGFELTGFSNADYARCKDTFKSTSGGAQFLGEKLVSRSSKKQDCTALSTAEAKYVSLFACYAQILWMRT
ncbi:retrovirus-related pol polyprotein from transposon TNT 1-94, partial [Tanacetum coccineum]